jgi:hypothetical protein
MLSLRKVISCSSRCSATALRKWHPTTTPTLGWPLLRHASTTSAPSAPPPASVKALSESFLDGTSAVYVEEMYKAWKNDSNSVHKSWDAFFRNADAGLQPGSAYMSPPTLGGGTPVSAAPKVSVFTSCSLPTLFISIFSYSSTLRWFSMFVFPLNSCYITTPPPYTASPYNYNTILINRAPPKICKQRSQTA